jgi:N-carbamoylputrescine amidase
MNQDRQIVAAVQYEPKLLDVSYNLLQGQQLAFEAAVKGAAVVVLPELCLSGYVMRDKYEAASCAQTANGYQTEAFMQITKKYNMHIVFGFIELKEGKLYNSAAVIGPQGLVATCQKHNLWGSDYLWAESADNLLPVIITRAGRLGVLICRDAMNNDRDTYKFFKENHRYYKKGSTDTIALLTNWGADYGYPDSSWVELSEEICANVIVSNRVGKERDMKYKGGSCVIDRNRKIYTYGSSFNEAAVVGGYVIL